MPRRGQTTVDFNPIYFDEILKSARIDELTKDAAVAAGTRARETAPVDTGSYKRQIYVESREGRYRRTWRLIGRDPKTLLIESRTGNLARALKATKR